MWRLLPLNVNGKKLGNLCRLIILRVISSDHVTMKRLSWLQVTPLILYECRFAYFLYRTSGEKVFMSEGVSNILTLRPVATKKNIESGENAIAVTSSLKLKWAITTLRYMLMMSEKPSTSIDIRVLRSGERQSDAMFDLFWKGSVCAIFVVKLNMLILLPTGDNSS